MTRHRSPDSLIGVYDTWNNGVCVGVFLPCELAIEFNISNHNISACINRKCLYEDRYELVDLKISERNN